MAAAVLLAGCSSTQSDPAPSPTQLFMTGKVTVDNPPNVAEDVSTEQTDCHGIGGYSDLHTGAAVLIQDNAGAIVGKGEIDSSAWMPDALRVCVFYWTATAAPGSPFYGIQIGDRRPVVLSAAEVAQPIELTLGTSG